MPRLMSFAHTVEQIRARTKTVTRRLTWQNLKSGERFWAVERLRGLKKGSHVKRLALLECVSNRREPIAAVLTASVAEISKEGFPAMGPGGFLLMFAFINNLRGPVIFDLRSKPPKFSARWSDLEVSRIEFKYIDQERTKT